MEMLVSRKRRSWAILAAGCAVAGALVLAACGGGGGTAAPAPPAPAPAPTETGAPATGAPAGTFASADIPNTKPLKIHFVESIIANEFAQAQIEEIKKLVAEHGDTVDISDANFDPQKQFSNCQDAVASGKYDGILIQSVDQVGIVPCVEDAIKAGILVAATENPIGPAGDTSDPQVPGMVGSVFNPFPPDGKATADLIVQACGDLNPCKVAYLSGPKVFAYEAGRRTVLDAELAKHPNIQLVFEGEAAFQYDLGYKLTQDLLQAHPDVNVIDANGDQPAFGALQALKDAGVTGPKVIGTAASVQGVQAVKDGLLFGDTTTMPRTSIRAAYTMIKQKIAGVPIPDNGLGDMLDLSPIGPIITKENADQFPAEWSCGACVLK